MADFAVALLAMIVTGGAAGALIGIPLGMLAEAATGRFRK